MISAVPQALRVIMYRRVMYNFIALQKIAELEGAKALVTGESLGQVASQTLGNIAAVNEAVTIPVLRPLIGSDKQEIIRRAPRHQWPFDIPQRRRLPIKLHTVYAFAGLRLMQECEKF